MDLTGNVDIYLYSSALCAFVCVCVISNQSTSKKPHFVSDLSKLDALLHTKQGPSGTRVPSST